MTKCDHSQVDIVITAPAPYSQEFAYSIRARSTLGVLTQIIAEAKQHVVLAAPFVQAELILELSILAKAITEAMRRQVVVDIMTTRENLDLPIFRTYARDYPGRVRLFHPVFPQSETSNIGSHAKFCIGDEDAAYVGSANLTAPALGAHAARGPRARHHFEMGLFVQGAAARQLAAFWHHAVRLGVFLPLTGS